MTPRPPWKPKSRMPYEKFKRWYDEVYLRSEYWQDLRRRVFNARGCRCERCGSASDCVVHHRTYERLCEEELGDLEVLCSECHDTVHIARRLDLPQSHPRVVAEMRRRKRDRADALASRQAAAESPSGPDDDLDAYSEVFEESLPELAFENLGWELPREALEPVEPGVDDEYPSLA